MTTAYDPGVGTDSDYTERVGMALAAVRDYFGLTQGELAKAAGTSTSTISRYENGRSAPQAETLYNIARALRIPVSVLADPAPGRDAVFELLAFHRAQQRADDPGRG